MQKQAPTFGRLLTMVLFALSCFGLLLFLWLSFGGPTPLAPKGYRVQVGFPEATQLGLEADVRVAGVTVGKVRDKQLAPEGNRTLATLEIDPGFSPLPRDVRATLRQKTLLGETYVELTPGTRAGPTLREGSRLPDARVQATVELDEVIQAFDPATRTAFRTWQQELAKGIERRGADLSGAIGTLPAFSRSATALLQVLDGQEDDVRRLVRNTGSVFEALSQDEGRLRTLVTGAGDTFAATAARQEDLAQTIRILPTFLDESRLTFASLERFARRTRPVVRDLRPAAQDLVPAVRDLRTLAPRLERTYRSLDPLISASKDGLPALTEVLGAAKPLLGSLQPFLEELNPVLEWLEVHQSTTSDFFTNGAAALADTTATRTPQERGHYLRQFGPNGLETVAMWPDRLPSNRGNAYLKPDAGTGAEHAKYMALPSFDCDNTGHATPYLTKLPDPKGPATDQTSDAPSCWVQGVQTPPTGVAGKYPRITRADYSAGR
ncbi:MlaD family protein [Conexibacter sp. SYSU D00693]|uniref:MlaD family protein n=1 Tax=Conexibacter sp. SYSU D00693 TaxID=2812560 RepID=UPI00196B82E4|nr:MlaD family protein [Conexibacter sp. SYSU D00693]